MNGKKSLERVQFFFGPVIVYMPSGHLHGQVKMSGTRVWAEAQRSQGWSYRLGRHQHMGGVGLNYFGE